MGTATGDMKNNMKKLQSQIKKMNYKEDVNYNGIACGDVVAYLPLYHYLFTDFSCPVAKRIADAKFEVFGKSDLKFMETVYRIMRDLFSYKPPLTKDQFFSSGFAERKVIMCAQMIEKISALHRKLAPKPVKTIKSMSSCQESPRKLPDEAGNHKRRFHSGSKTAIKEHESSDCIQPSTTRTSEKRATSELCLPKTHVIKEIPDISESFPKPAPVLYEADFKHLKSTTAPLSHKTTATNLQKTKSGPVKSATVCKGTTGIKANIHQGLDNHVAVNQSDNTINQKLAELPNMMENILARMTLLENRVAIIEQQMPNSKPSTLVQTPPKPVIQQGIPYAPETIPITPENPLSPINIVTHFNKPNSPEVTMINKDIDVDDHTSKASSTPEHSLSNIMSDNLSDQQKKQAWKILDLMKSTKNMIYGKSEGNNNNNNNNENQNPDTDDTEKDNDNPGIECTPNESEGEDKIVNSPI